MVHDRFHSEHWFVDRASGLFPLGAITAKIENNRTSELGHIFATIWPEVATLWPQLGRKNVVTNKRDDFTDVMKRIFRRSSVNDAIIRVEHEV